MQAYDEATGQMYNETTVRVHSMVPTWTNTCTGKPQDPKTFVNKSVGTSSLRETATRTCAWYINDFSLELFTDTNIDWLPIKPIYDQLRETSVTSHLLAPYRVFADRVYQRHTDLEGVEPIPSCLPRRS
jgi:hypothetical protein